MDVFRDFMIVRLGQCVLFLFVINLLGCGADEEESAEQPPKDIYLSASNEENTLALWKLDGASLTVTEVAAMTEEPVGQVESESGIFIFSNHYEQPFSTDSLWYFNKNTEQLSHAFLLADLLSDEDRATLRNFDQPDTGPLGSSFSVSLNNLVAKGRDFYFTTQFVNADNQTAKLTLWKTQGTLDSTQALASSNRERTKDDSPFISQSALIYTPEGIVVRMGEKILITQGAPENTDVLLDLAPFDEQFLATQMLYFDGDIYFRHSQSEGFSMNLAKLSLEDRSFNVLTPFSLHGLRVSEEFFTHKNFVYFIVTEGEGSEIQLWRTNATPSGTEQLTSDGINVDYRAFRHQAGYMVTTDDSLGVYFSAWRANQFSGDREIWRVNDSASETTFVEPAPWLFGHGFDFFRDSIIYATEDNIMSFNPETQMFTALIPAEMMAVRPELHYLN